TLIVIVFFNISLYFIIFMHKNRKRQRRNGKIVVQCSLICKKGVTDMREVVIVEACRTAVGKRKGALSHYRADDLLADVLAALVEKAGIDKALVDDVIAGCVTQVNEQAMNVARTAALIAGFPITVPGVTIDRQCGSSQQAIHFATQAILAG